MRRSNGVILVWQRQGFHCGRDLVGQVVMQVVCPFSHSAVSTAHHYHAALIYWYSMGLTLPEFW